MIFRQLMAKARNYLLLGSIGAVVILFAIVFFLVQWVRGLSADLREETAKVANLQASFSEFQAESSLIAHTVDMAAEDDREIEQVRSDEHDFVLASSGRHEDDPDRGWGEFFDFLRSDPPDRTGAEGGVASEPVPVPE